MSDALPTTELHHLATFKSRGVAVPFTSPLLAGTRVRESDRTGVELVVPSPSGGRGVYVLNWPGVRALCNPSVHDTLLFRRFNALTAINPTTIREAALEVAVSGAAGQEAAAAAEMALASDSSHRRLTHLLLSRMLMEQVEPSEPKIKSPADQTVDSDHLAAAALQRTALSLGRHATQLAIDLSSLANLLAPLGIAPDDVIARTPRLLICLKEAHDDLSHWLSADAANDISGVGHSVLGAILRICRIGHAVLTNIRLAASDPMGLMKRWINDAKSVASMIARCGWLLDGWERVGLLWLSTTGTAPRRAALLEMASMLPVLPREVMQWNDISVTAQAMEQPCRVTSRDDTWRTGGAAFSFISRNEKLLAMRV